MKKGEEASGDMSARTEQVVSNAFGAKGSRDQKIDDR